MGRRPEATSERELDALRREARSGGVVPRSGVRPPGAPFPVASGETGYYGRPLLKEPTWTWEVPLYFFVGGAAGAAAVVGASARLADGDVELARDARWVAAVGGALAAPLLISDLGRPERFLNMLRVFKLQSPMSVGAWTLTAFGSASAAAAFAELLDGRGGAPVRLLGNAAELVSAATGLSMATYTGVLVGATNIPAWNRSAGVLPIHFAASGLGVAVSLLELLGHRRAALNRLGIVAALVETAVGAAQELDHDPALVPLKRGRSGAVVRAGGMLSGPLPLALRLLGARRSAAVAALAGSLLIRYGWVSAGRESARDPAVPLQLDESARAGELPAGAALTER